MNPHDYNHHRRHPSNDPSAPRSERVYQFLELLAGLLLALGITIILLALGDSAL